MAACRKVALTIVRGTASRDIDVWGGIVFGGVLNLPKGVRIDDLPALYREWAEAHRPENGFTDWLLKRGFTEDEVGFVHLFDEE